MDDDRVWAFEKGLWTGDAEHYRDLIDESCVMVLPQPPFVMEGGEAIRAVAGTPRWSEVTITDGHIVRPQEGLIVIAYHVHASREGGEDYDANCTSTYRRLSHDQWRVVQHQQTPPLISITSSGEA